MACGCGLCVPNMIITKAMRKNIWGNLFAFPLRKRKRTKNSRFSFVIVSVQMVSMVYPMVILFLVVLCVVSETTKGFCKGVFRRVQHHPQGYAHSSAFGTQKPLFKETNFSWFLILSENRDTSPSQGHHKLPFLGTEKVFQ